MTYAQLEPFGEQRGDIRASLVGTAICNTLGHVNGAKKNIFKPMDLMPQFGDSKSGGKTSGSQKRKPLTSAAEWGSLKQMMATNYARDEGKAKSTKPKRLNISDRRRRMLESQGAKLPEV